MSRRSGRGRSTRSSSTSTCRSTSTEAAAERAVGLGATRLADGPTWITLADPAGHPFDLCQKDGVGPVMELFAVTIDAPDASALARFYADLLGMEVTYEGPEGALIAGDGKSVMFQQVSDYNPPRWPDPAHPQQAHLDIMSTTSTPARHGRWSWARPGWRAAASGSGSSPTRPGTRSASSANARRDTGPVVSRRVLPRAPRSGRTGSP